MLQLKYSFIYLLFQTQWFNTILENLILIQDMVQNFIQFSSIKALDFQIIVFN